MKINTKTSALLLAFALSGCGVGQLQQRVEKLEKDFDTVRTMSAEQTSDLNALTEELRRLRGMTEEIQYGHKNTVNGELAHLQQNVQDLRRRVPPPALVPVIALESDEIVAQSVSGETGRLFSNGLVFLREGNFASAGTSLQSFYESVVEDPNLAPRALFWQGLAAEGRGDFPNALGYYNELGTRFPRHERAALGLLRQGSVFVRLKDFETAKLSFQKLIATYPGSSEATQAKEKLADL
jgi:TolA-binding protein